MSMLKYFEIVVNKGDLGLHCSLHVITSVRMDRSNLPISKRQSAKLLLLDKFSLPLLAFSQACI